LCQRHVFSRAAIWNGNVLYRGVNYIYPLSLYTTSSTRNIYNAGSSGVLNYVNNTPITHLAPCFAGMRGSMHWAYAAGGDSGTVSFSRVPRKPVVPATCDDNFTPSTSTVGPAYDSIAPTIGANSQNSGAGTALYPLVTQAGCTVVVPFISNQRFVGTWPSPFETATTPRAYTEGLAWQVEETVDAQAEAGPQAPEYYCAAGPDFNLFFFVGIPTMDFVPTIPTPGV
jgi:hypothetical protein